MDTKKKSIVFAGAIFRDLVTCTPRFPKPGETLFGTDFFTGFGGKSANQAVMCKLLSSTSDTNVAMIGKLGDDDNGKAYLEHFKKLDMDLSQVEVVRGKPNGVATIFVNTDSGENAIAIVPGANEVISAKDIENADDLFKDARTVVCALEMNSDTVKAAFIKGKKYGAMTILNAAPGQSALDPDISRHTDLLCVNESEAEIMSGVPVNNLEEAKEALAKLVTVTKRVVLTLGEQGAILQEQGSHPIHVRVKNTVKVVDTTGAGDAFVGSLAFFLSNPEFEGLSLEEVVQRSCIVASYSVQKPGTQSSYPSKNELPNELFQ